MTNIDILKWIRKNLSPFIQKAVAARPGCIYTEDWLAGICCREVGGLISKYAFSPAGNAIDVMTVCSLMRGDYSQRPGESEKSYHGYGVTQIDIASFPEFVRSGDWKDPLKCFIKSIDVLNSARTYLINHEPGIAGEMLNHYITAAYNCGPGNEAKVIARHLDPDAYTTNHDYAKAVFQFADAYRALPPM